MLVALAIPNVYQQGSMEYELPVDQLYELWTQPTE